MIINRFGNVIISDIIRIFKKQKQHTMKKYSYSIEVDFINKGDNFLDSLMNEVKDERNQLALTYKINLATKELHKKILLGYAKELNIVLKKVGLHFDETPNVSKNNIGNTNKYEAQYIMCRYPNSVYSHVIMIGAESDSNFKDSKYTTFTGDYYLAIGITNQGQVWSGTKDELFRCEKNVDALLKEMRGALKSHISKTMEMA